jgi:hypothetical protein
MPTPMLAIPKVARIERPILSRRVDTFAELIAMGGSLTDRA